MASKNLASIRRDLGLLADLGAVASLEDVELLERFLEGRDHVAEAAFEAIVIRHGPMVLGICRSLLHNPGDADDAFQATFLVLIRRAGSIRVQDSLRPWLYGVAWRVSRKLQAVVRKRRSLETSGELARTIAAQEPVDSDLRPILIEELGRLPERYRTPIVLFHFEGLTHEEVARQLRCPVGTISSRLSRARELLRSRLTRRGVLVPLAIVTSSLAAREARALPPILLRSTVRSWAGTSLSSTVNQLSQGVLVSMFANKLMLAGLAILAGTIAVGVAFGRLPGDHEPPVPRVNPETGRPLISRETKAEGATTEKAPSKVEPTVVEEAPIVPRKPDDPPRQASVEAPAVTGITIDGDLKDWPAAMPRYPIKSLHNMPNAYGFNGLERADLSTSADLSAAFSVAYDPNEQVIYLAVIVRDDVPIVGDIQFWDTDAVEVFVDGLHSEQWQPFPDDKDGETLDAADLPLLQYIGKPGPGRVYGVRRSAGEDRPVQNPILMFGDIKKTKTRMAYRREKDVTTYEWAVQAFDHYPDKPTQLIPFKKIGFDVVVVDRDKPAPADGPTTEPEEDRSAWITWSPLLKVPAFLHADRLGEIVLGRIP